MRGKRKFKSGQGKVISIFRVEWWNFFFQLREFFSTKDKEPLKIERQFSLYISKCQTSQKAAEINLQETSGFRTKAVNNLSLYFPLRSNKQVCSHMERCSHKKKIVRLQDQKI